jgi:hypothetical protein
MSAQINLDSLSAPWVLPSIGDPRELAAAIDDEFVELIGTAELQAARCREFVPDGVPANRAVHAALDAAVQGGIAIGLERARTVIAELLQPRG